MNFRQFYNYLKQNAVCLEGTNNNQDVCIKVYVRTNETDDATGVSNSLITEYINKMLLSGDIIEIDHSTYIIK